MERRISALINATPAKTMAALSNPSTFPEWVGLVDSVEQVDETTWNITLKARLGPLARSKRLRMCRTLLSDERIRFERVEVDGRDHAEWILDATITNQSPPDPPSPETSSPPEQSLVVADLAYTGTFWSPPVEKALSAFEGLAAQRLDAYLGAN